MSICISIHALREEGDKRYLGTNGGDSYFYPRPPRGGRRISGGTIAEPVKHFYPRPPRGGRRIHNSKCIRECGFLSTPSARRATFSGSVIYWSCINFYPRPPRGGRQNTSTSTGGTDTISIHALREEGDLLYFVAILFVSVFLSTPSARRATKGYKTFEVQVIISIHALREEGDLRRAGWRSRSPISIHALREEGDFR